MKNDKKMFVLVEMVLAALVVILAFVMVHEKNGQKPDKISVIVEDADNSQWAAFKYGLKMAAKDQGIEIFVVSTGDMLTTEEEKKVIEDEIAHGADGLIVQPVLGEDTEKMLKKINKKIPVMLVERTASQENEQSKMPVVEPDHYAMGKALAEELLKDYNDNLEGKTLGIFSESEQSEAKNRKKGFMDTIKNTGAEIRWSVEQSLNRDEKRILEQQETVDVIVALDNSSLTAAGKSSSMGKLHSSLLYGIGNSTETIYYLDTRVIECLIVPDEFNVGYQSLTEAAKNLKNYFYQMSDHTVSYTIIRRDTLFSKENQEILFTMSQ